MAERLTIRWLTQFDPYLLPIVYLLAGWGNATVWRLSHLLGLRQSIWLVVGTLAYLVVLKIPKLFHHLARYRFIWLISGFILIGFTLLPGILSPSNHPNLWLSLGSLNLQPSEPLKIILIIYLAAYFSDKLTINPRSWSLIVPSLVIILTSLLLLFLQKDLGTATLVLLIYTLMLFAIFPRKRILLLTAIILFISAAVGYYFNAVIRLRVDAWLNPWNDPTGKSYQIVQSLISLATGGFLGTGPGLGAPSLVPVSVSDFIFTAIMEETGMLGGIGLLILVFLLFSRTIQSAQKAATPFNALLAGGLGILLALQSLLIIGGNIRLIPLTGVTLPFVSYGGSSLVTSFIAIGLILRVSNQTPKAIQAIPIIDTIRSKILFLFIIGFSAILLLIPYWSVIQSKPLTARGDNLRRALNDKYVYRGSILDREGKPINSTVGTPGDYKRTYSVLQLANIIGYAQPLYGLSGLESSFDSILRGSVGYPALKLWWTNLLTTQTPPGLNLRLSLDLTLQNKMDTSLSTKAGAGIIMNAETGEILALTSIPGFDPSTLENDWDQLVIDPETPLLNRVVNGKYPVGSTTSLFLYANALQNNLNTDGFSTNPVFFDEKKLSCASNNIAEQAELSQLLQYSCPQIGLSVARDLGKINLYQAYSKLGWYQIPSLPLPENEAADPGMIHNLKLAAIGQENLAISPLQMAISVASISASGSRPNPKLGMSYQNPEGRWLLFNTDNSRKQVFSDATVTRIQELTKLDSIPAWGVVGHGLRSKDQWVTWFLGGTTSDWNGSPVIVVIVLEGDDPQEAFQIGKLALTDVVER
jgi:cell division protein FtsW (lipid II flippase)